MFKPITRELKLAHGSRRERRRVSRATESRLRPGRQGVQRIYRLTQEKEMIGEYEYLESIGVPRAQALQVMSRASTAFEREAVRRGQDPKAMKFGAEEMREEVEFLKASGGQEDAVGFFVLGKTAGWGSDVATGFRPLFEYMEATFERPAEMFVDDVTKRPSLLGLDAHENAKTMVDFLLSTGSTKEEAVEYLLRTL